MRNKGLKLASRQTARLRGRVDWGGNARGRGYPAEGSCRRRPKSAILKNVSIDSETPMVEDARRRTKIDVVSDRPLGGAGRSGRKRQGSRMPSIRPQSTSSRIGHFKWRFGRLGNAKVRGCLTRGYNRRRRRAATLDCGSSVSERPTAEKPEQRAETDVAPKRPPQVAFRAAGRYQPSEIPNRGLESTSPRIGHRMRRFDRFGNTLG